MNTPMNPVVILLVDDDEEDIYATKRAFSEGKIVNDFRSVRSGPELFDYLENKGEFVEKSDNPRPHIILLDINMPQMDGFEVLEALRSKPAFRSIPVVMLTTSEQGKDVLDSYDRGANSFITKPVSIEGMMNIARDFQEYWFQLVKIPNTSIL